MKMKKIFQKIKRFFAPPGYFETESLDFSTDDLFQTPDRRGSSLFLGKYTIDEIDMAMKHFGIFPYLKKLGYYPVRIYMDCSDLFKHRLVLYVDSLTQSNILVEAVLQKKAIKNLESIPIPPDSLHFLSIEWLLLQHPRGSFTAAKPRLPNQQYPGLGIGKKVLTLLKLVARELNLAGLINVPEYFHNAAMYSKRFFFLSKEYEAMVRKLNATLVQQYGLATTSWAIERGCIYLNQKEFSWSGSPQIIPVIDTTKSYFHSDEYKRQLEDLYDQYEFSFDEIKFRKSLQTHPIPGFSEFISLAKK